MRKIVATPLLWVAGGVLVAGCSTLSCDSYMSYSDIMESWVGGDLIQYERRNNIRPMATLKRPQNRTEYSYRVKDEWNGDQHYECVTRMTADDATGEIVSWSYEGNACYGYCTD